jgi:hypothetical protein
MISLPSPAAGVVIRLNPQAGTWQVSADAERTLRPWNWGERRHMVAACTLHGRFDGTAFATAVANTLFNPPPPPELASLHALIALDLLGLGHGSAPKPLAAAEARLAARFGWLPSMLAPEPAPALDSLLASLDAASPDEAPPTPGATAASGGWNSIRVVGDADG